MSKSEEYQRGFEASFKSLNLFAPADSSLDFKSGWASAMGKSYEEDKERYRCKPFATFRPQRGGFLTDDKVGLPFLDKPLRSYGDHRG